MLSFQGLYRNDVRPQSDLDCGGNTIAWYLHPKNGGARTFAEFWGFQADPSVLFSGILRSTRLFLPYWAGARLRRFSVGAILCRLLGR